MIVSHQRRYVFIELPLTGSTAIAKELVECYGGESFLKKHSTYQDFERAMGPKAKNYFVFSGIRNPLDQVVSHYMKLQTDHKGRYSRLENGTRPGERGLHFSVLRWVQRRRYQFVNGDKQDFRNFLFRFYRLPYSNWSIVSHKQFNSVIRFEALTEDFERTLKAIGIEPVRPLPVRNRTKDKEDWTTYYHDPAVRRHAIRVFGPFMREWGYPFPADWEVQKSTEMAGQTLYSVLNVFRGFYWRHLRYRI
jgi:hypothetical protein